MKTKFKTILGTALGIAVFAIAVTLLPDGKTAQAAEIAIDATNFPDENFRDYVKINIDTDGNNILSEHEIEKITSINVRGKTISNLMGIEYFIYLSNLNCLGNELTELDISKNINLVKLDCEQNELSHLDTSKNINLVELYCGHNKLNNLDITKNIDLEILDCQKNELLTLNINKNINLTELICSQNQLSNLYTNNNIFLTRLWCGGNKLKSIDISKNINLVALHCSSNELINLDVSKNINLVELYCSENKLENLELDKNINLISLICSLNKNLKTLYLSYKVYNTLTLNISDLHNKIDTVISNLINITKTHGVISEILAVTDITKPAKYHFSNSEYSGDFTIIYVQDDTPVTPSPAPSPTPSGNFTKPNCTRLFNDYKYTNPVSGSPVVIYGNGGTFKTGTVKTTNKQFTAYTDILASYKYTLNSKGIVKPAAGKVIVGITKSDTKPSVTKNKIVDKEAAKIARAKIKNGQVTVTATGKEKGLVYLWIIDTGDNGVSECCPVNVLMAPRKLEVQDTSGSKLKNPKLQNGKTLNVCVAGIAPGNKKTDDCTYTAIVDANFQNYISIAPSGNSGNQFTITAKGLKNNKNTKAVVIFQCNENGKKLKFALTVTP